MSETVKRLPTPDEGRLPDGLDTGAICYWQAEGVWYLYLPGGGIGNLSGHAVIEHDDGTITVAPSILLNSGGTRRRHGYLKRGKWEPCGDDVPTPTEADR